MGTWSQIFLESPTKTRNRLKSAISPTGNVLLKLTCDFKKCLLLSLLYFLKCGAFKSCCCRVVFPSFRNPVWRNALSSPVTMRIPHSNAFIDLNKDFTAGKSVMFKQCPTMRNICTSFWRVFRADSTFFNKKCYQTFAFLATYFMYIFITATNYILQKLIFLNTRFHSWSGLVTWWTCGFEWEYK